ncbi:MAG: hypothetical protein ACLPID_10770 [Beijerinckiaceae bacterium]
MNARVGFVVPLMTIAIASFVALVTIGIRSAEAVRMCGQRNFNGTLVQECYDAADSYVTFSNACGTQRVDAQAASHGAIPDQLVPCPRRGVNTQPGKSVDESDHHDFLMRMGREQFASGDAAFDDGRFSEAALDYAYAESCYESAGANFAAARRNKNLSICNAYIHSVDTGNPETLRQLLGEGEKKPEIQFHGPILAGLPDRSSTSRFGACLEFPHEAEQIRRKLAALEQEKQDRIRADQLRAQRKRADDDRLPNKCSLSGKTCAGDEICSEWSTPGEGYHSYCTKNTNAFNRCQTLASQVYDPSLGQNRSFMSAACLYYCLYHEGTSDAFEFFKLYAESQTRANNMCSMDIGECNNIKQERCR